MPNVHRDDHRKPATEMLTVHSPQAYRTQNMAKQLPPVYTELAVAQRTPASDRHSQGLTPLGPPHSNIGWSALRKQDKRLFPLTGRVYIGKCK